MGLNRRGLWLCGVASLTIFVAFVLDGCAGRKAKATNPGQHSEQPKPEALKPRYGPVRDVSRLAIVILSDEIVKPAALGNRARSRDRLENYESNAKQRVANEELLMEIMAKYAIDSKRVLHTYTELLVGFCAELSPVQVKALRLNPHIAAVHYDEFFEFQQFAFQTFDGDFFDPGHVEPAVAQAGGPMDGSAKDTWIWIVDSGIDLDHPDLNVETDPVFAEPITTDTPDDSFGHGTMVAGLVAAKANDFGTCGVSAGARVVPINVSVESFFGDVGTTLSAALDAFDHIAKFCIIDDVVNLSFGQGAVQDCGESGTSGVLANTIEALGWLGVWTCIGSGNDGDCDGSETTSPACTNGIRVITVGALSGIDDCLSISNWGPSVDWAARGDAFSTHPDGKYAAGRGTSFSAPIVAGIVHQRAALPVEARPVDCCGSTYRTAHLSTLNRARFDADIELVEMIVDNVRDLDGNEDIFGRLEVSSVSVGDDEIMGTEVFFSRDRSDALHTGNGTVSIGERRRIADGLSYDQLRGLSIIVGGTIGDEEGLLGPRMFECDNCTDFNSAEDEGFRTVNVLNATAAVRSINGMTVGNGFRPIQFGADDFFQLNFFENGNSQDGRIRAMWRLRARARAPLTSCMDCHP